MHPYVCVCVPTCLNVFVEAKGQSVYQISSVAVHRLRQCLSDWNQWALLPLLWLQVSFTRLLGIELESLCSGHVTTEPVPSLISCYE